MKFKHSIRNYLLAPIIILVNPIVAIINYLLKYLSDKVDKAFDSLPRFDLDYSKEYKESQGSSEPNEPHSHKRVVDKLHK